jgi:hypothetical protein
MKSCWRLIVIVFLSWEFSANPVRARSPFTLDWLLFNCCHL